jgi:TRAP-type C4-dicarboxylate transport system substrate-binding protein
MKKLLLSSIGVKAAMACAFAGLLSATFSAHAQELPKTTLKVIGSISGLPVYKEYEVPFWTKTLSDKSKGAVTAELKGFNEMGLKGPEVLRLMSSGVIEMGSAILGYLASDDPSIEAVDMAGMNADVAAARRVTDAAKPMLEKLLRDKFGVKLLAVGTYPAQVAYCNGEIKGLADLKGKKVRVGGRSQAELIEALGGAPVTMAFGEVVPALQNKVVDCALTGTLSGNVAKWHEVTTHLLALPMSWGQIAYVAQIKAWDKLDPAVRNLIDTEVKVLERSIWDAAELHTTQGYACNGGTDDCKLGQKGKMKIVQPSDADRALLKKIVADTMVPKWAARSTPEAVKAFNDGIGKVAGVTAKK